MQPAAVASFLRRRGREMRPSEGRHAIRVDLGRAGHAQSSVLDPGGRLVRRRRQRFAVVAGMWQNPAMLYEPTWILFASAVVSKRLTRALGAAARYGREAVLGLEGVDVD